VSPSRVKWLDRAADAARRYNEAIAATRKAIEERRSLPYPQGYEAVLGALHRELDAQRKYTEAINAFARAVLDAGEASGDQA
jgi:hypothetical protein